MPFDVFDMMMLAGAPVRYSPPTWTPASLGAALVGFLDFEDNTKITTVSGAISQIVDSVNAAAWTQGTSSSRPLLTTSATTGRQVAKLDGVDDFLDNAPVNAAYPLTGTVVWACGCVQLAAGADASARYLLTQGGTALTTDIGFRRRNQSNISQLVGNIGATTTVAGPAANVSPFIVFSGPSLAQQTVTGGNCTPTLNNVDAPAPIAVTLPNNNTRGRLGAQASAAPANFFQGEYSFFLFLNAALSSDQQNNLNIWTAGRLGLR